VLLWKPDVNVARIIQVLSIVYGIGMCACVMSQILFPLTTGCKVAALVVTSPILVLFIPEVGSVWFPGWVSSKNCGM